MIPILVYVLACYGLACILFNFVAWNRRRLIKFEPKTTYNPRDIGNPKLETVSDIHFQTERRMKFPYFDPSAPKSERSNQPWTEDDVVSGLFNALGQKITPHTDAAKRCNPGPCPMPEIEGEPGHYICQVCGYEIDYRKTDPVRSDEL